MNSLVVEKIAENARKYPERIAYKNSKESISYGDLWEKADKNSRLLAKEDKYLTIFYGNKDVSTFLAIISCLIKRWAYVPISPGMPADRRMDIIKTVCLNGTEDIAYIMFTSGSTGKPKGVPISVENLDNFVRWISSFKPLSDYKACNVLNQANFSFDLSVADMYYSLCNGHTLVSMDLDIIDKFDKICPLFADEKINVAMLTPTFIRLSLLDEDFNSKNCPELKCIYSCGEFLDKKTAKKLLTRFPELKLINAYGPTEATSAVSGIVINDAMLKDERSLPVGDMRTNATEIVIDDGEIVLKGKSVSAGYLASEEAGGFYKEGNLYCYRTGDLGYIENGMLYCTGRKDSQVKYKGYRIELQDIENNINSIPGVHDCAVIAKYTDGNSVKTIKAFAVTEDSKYDSNYIREKLQQKVPDYMIPRTIEILGRLPVTQNGKIDRKGLAEL